MDEEIDNDLLFAWGSPEGHHNIFNMNTSLLGGAFPPLLD